MNAAARAPAAQPQGGLQILQGSVGGDGEGFLLIDDLVDTGVKEFKQNPWIFFPWDIDYRLAKPIHDGGRAGGARRVD